VCVCVDTLHKGDNDDDDDDNNNNNNSNSPKTTGFMIAIQAHSISTNNYNKRILKDPNVANDICRKCRQKS
jgi:hypothetical protein